MAKSKKDDRPASSWEIVRAVKIEDGFATCVCGNKIKLKPEGPILKYGKRQFLPHLIGVICRKCNRGSTMSEYRSDATKSFKKAARLPEKIRTDDR